MPSSVKRPLNLKHVRSRVPLPSPLDKPRCLWGLRPCSLRKDSKLCFCKNNKRRINQKTWSCLQSRSLCAAVYFSGSSYSCSRIRTNLRGRAGSLRTDAPLVGCITISDARPADRLCSKHHCAAAAGKHAAERRGRASACPCVCKYLQHTTVQEACGQQIPSLCRVCAPRAVPADRFERYGPCP